MIEVFPLAPDLTYPPAPQRWPPAFPPSGASAWGGDQYGLWIEVVIGGPPQRFRWIEPGEFLMGSPEGEPQRFDDEGPQHVVRLTEGYWLAETACPQVVWKAVMGANLSGFKDDPQNPVENVSWDDVAGKDGFLTKLKGLLPGLQAALPTEAEWEYACRAGTETVFNWGSDTITPAQANYDASVVYNKGPTGENRRKTMQVRSFPPNAWGLYQMHGNVWEWCADGVRTYDDSTPQQDPRSATGDEEGGPRVVRGGSWIYFPHGLRSACRSSRPRDWRDRFLGFRFLLRSTSPGAERPPEAAGTSPPTFRPIPARRGE